jgi:hypothetical protein
MYNTEKSYDCDKWSIIHSNNEKNMTILKINKKTNRFTGDKFYAKTIDNTKNTIFTIVSSW